jgi:colanic acid/amylovoran biosynthesis protein
MQPVHPRIREESLAELVARMWRDYQLGSGIRVLDLGCASLRAYSVYTLGVASEYVGVDSDTGELQAARRSGNSRTGQDPTLVHANAEHLPFVDGHFDVVVCNDMLAYTEKRRVLAEAFRVLRPGGHFLCLYNNGIGWSLYKLRHPEKMFLVEWMHSVAVIISTSLYRTIGLRPFHTTFNTLYELKHLARARGFELLSAWRDNIGFMKLNLIAKKPASSCVVRPIAIITGGYLSQNMGSAAMSIVTAERLAAAGFSVRVLSKYPIDDALFAERYRIELQSTPQLIYTFLVIPLLILVAVIGKAMPSLKTRIRRRLFSDPRLCFDVGGITFSIQRGVAGLAINTTWLLLPLLLDIPLLKGAQAIGPFGTGLLWRVIASLLRRSRCIYSRGAYTKAVLDNAKIPNRSAGDIAFLLNSEPWDLPADVRGREFIALVPSSIVMKVVDRRNGCGAYVKQLAEVIDLLATPQRLIVLIAHSYRSGNTLNSNDLPVCRAIHARCTTRYVVLVDVVGRSPGELKFLIGQSALCVTGRFHAMVAALASGVPVLVTSWSHKYAEVLAQFGQEHCSVAAEDISAPVLQGMIQQILANAGQARKQIAAAMPAVRLAAERNFEFIGSDVEETLRRIRDS